jgi:hypothetical protein
VVAVATYPATKPAPISGQALAERHWRKSNTKEVKELCISKLIRQKIYFCNISPALKRFIHSLLLSVTDCPKWPWS